MQVHYGENKVDYLLLLTIANYPSSLFCIFDSYLFTEETSRILPYTNVAGVIESP